MKIRHLALGALACMCLGVGAAHAESPKAPVGYYVSGAGGASFLMDSDLKGSGIDTEAEFDVGPAAGASLGYRLPSGWRGEFDFGYRGQDVDKIKNATGSGGDLDAFHFTANVLYEFDIDAAVTPYLGAGFGVARLSANGITPVGGSRIDDTDNVPAIQAILGLNYGINEQLQLFGDYRFVHGFDPKFKTDSGVKVDADYDNHALMVGLRWSFGVPSPAPKTEPAVTPAAVAPEIPREFLVFFDWDRSDLTVEAAGIVSQAAGYAKQGKIVRIELTGHADRSGPATYNLGLSKRRAETVRKELTRLGVPKDEIAIAWKGETQPLVPTPDGVREPQNRRVEIIFP